MKIGESFYQIYQEKLKVSFESLTQTIINPNEIQSIENGVTLYLKKFANEKFSCLLIASQFVNGQEFFGFAYWIPKNIVTNLLTPLQILKAFAGRFGCKIKISDNEGYFIEKSTKVIEGRLISPFQIIEILENKDVPCETHVSTNEDYHALLNTVTAYYSFSINNNLYYLWLYSISTIRIPVQATYSNFLNNISKALNPYGKTKLLIHKPTNEVQNITKLTDVSFRRDERFDEIDLEIPVHYEKSFKHINNIISSLKPNQKLLIVPKTERDRCLFCNSESISQEHIFPKWLRPFFQNKEFSPQLHLQLCNESFESFNSSGVSKNKENLYGLTTHKVCINCNNRWMSLLEDRVKAILINKEGFLIKDVAALSVNDLDARTLAQWLCIKALLLSIRYGNVPNVAADTFLQLSKGIIPEYFVIEVIEFDFYDFDFQISSGILNDERYMRLKHIDRTIANEMARDFFKASILLGKLVFRISYFNEQTALKRHSYIKESTLIYPFRYRLPFIRNNIHDIWLKTGNTIKLRILHLMGLVLDEST